MPSQGNKFRIESAEEDGTSLDLALDKLSPGARAVVDRVGIIEILEFAQAAAGFLMKARDAGIPHEVQMLGLGCTYKASIVHPSAPDDVATHADEITEFATSAFLQYLQKKYGKERIPYTGAEPKN